MTELDRCPEMERILRALTLDKPIPQSLIEHTSECEHCLFWLSWSLAMKRAMLTTDRLKAPGCPEKEEFNGAMIIAVRGIKTSKGLIKKRSMKKIQQISFKELPGMQEFQEHIGECAICKSYWSKLNDAAIAAQEEYEALIKEGQGLRPAMTDTAQEQEIPAINFVPNPSQRPN